MYKRNIEARSHYHCRREKATIITYSENVFLVLVILHAIHMHRIMLLSVTCMGLDIISYTGEFSGKKVTVYKIYFNFLSKICL